MKFAPHIPMVYLGRGAELSDLPAAGSMQDDTQQEH